MSNPSFNLIDQPFIPCVTREGQHAEFSLLETLKSAHEIRELRDESPLVTIALHRLLLAILHRNFGPDGYDAWKTLWDAGRFDADAITAYFDKWRDRFDLFDEQHPFYQTAGLDTPAPLPIASLFDEQAVNNNDTLFDHSFNEGQALASSSVAARGVIARQAFALAFGQSPKGITINGKALSLSSRKDGPLARGVCFLVTGDSLFETLLLNLWSEDKHRDDLPVWEQNSPEDVINLPRATGVMDLYTAQCRRLKLEKSGSSPKVFGTVHFVQGREIEKAQLDPMKAYVRDDETGWQPFKLQADRLLWRDSSALFNAFSQPDQPFKAWHHVARALREGRFPRSGACGLNAIGVETAPQKATSIINWRHESLPLSRECLASDDLHAAIGDALHWAERGGLLIRRATHRLVGQVQKGIGEFSALDAEKSEDFTARRDAGGRRKADPKGNAAKSLAPGRNYWSRLQQPFRKLLNDLASQPDNTEMLIATWAWSSVRQTAIRAFEETTEQLDHSARTLRAVARATAQLRAQLHKEFEDQKEQIHGEEELRVATSVAD